MAKDQRKRGPAILKMDPHELKTHPLQPRIDYGSKEEWSTFKNDIRENGVLEPIKVVKKGDEWFITNGHRRVRAVLELIEEGCDIPTIDALSGGRGLSDTEILFGMMSSNNGKPLTTFEEAMVFRKLENWGVPQSEIARRRGVDPAIVSKRLKVVKGGNPKVLTALEKGQIRFSTALDIVNAAKDDDDQVRLLSEEKKVATGKDGRRTKGASTATKEAKKKKTRRQTGPRPMKSSDVRRQVNIVVGQKERILHVNEDWTEETVEGILIGLKIAAGFHPPLLPSGQVDGDPETFLDDPNQTEIPGLPSKKKTTLKPIVDKMAPARLKNLVKSGGTFALDDPGSQDLIPMAVKKVHSEGMCFELSVNDDGNVVWTPTGNHGKSGPGTITTVQG